MTGSFQEIVAPGYMDTNNTAPLIKDPVRSKEILGRIPAGRWGDQIKIKLLLSQ